MARRRRRTTRQKPPNLWFILFQIIILIALLVAVLGVTDSIGSGTSALVETLASEDIDVREREALEDSDFPGRRTDDGADHSMNSDAGDTSREETPPEPGDGDDPS